MADDRSDDEQADNEGGGGGMPSGGLIDYSMLNRNPPVMNPNDPSYNRAGPGGDAGMRASRPGGPIDTAITKYAGGEVNFNDRKAVAGFAAQVATDMNIRPALLLGLIQQESNYNQRDVSGAGAIGFTQLMPGTAASLGVNPHDPKQNIIGGAYYLKQMLEKFGGNEREALAAYNAGPGRMMQALGGTTHGELTPQVIASLPHESQDYMVKVEGYADQFEHSETLMANKSTASTPIVANGALPGSRNTLRPQTAAANAAASVPTPKIKLAAAPKSEPASTQAPAAAAAQTAAVKPALPRPMAPV